MCCWYGCGDPDVNLIGISLRLWMTAWLLICCWLSTTECTVRTTLQKQKNRKTKKMTWQISSETTTQREHGYKMFGILFCNINVHTPSRDIIKAQHRRQRKNTAGQMTHLQNFVCESDLSAQNFTRKYLTWSYVPAGLENDMNIFYQCMTISTENKIWADTLHASMWNFRKNSRYLLLLAAFVTTANKHFSNR